MDWNMDEAGTHLVLELGFAEMELTEEERGFLTDRKKTMSMNGSTPPSLHELDMIRQQIIHIGGKFNLQNLWEEGLCFEVGVPVDKNDPQDALEKLNIINNEIEHNQVKRNHPL